MKLTLTIDHARAQKWGGGRGGGHGPAFVRNLTPGPCQHRQNPYSQDLFGELFFLEVLRPPDPSFPVGLRPPRSRGRLGMGGSGGLRHDLFGGASLSFPFVTGWKVISNFSDGEASQEGLPGAKIRQDFFHRKAFHSCADVQSEACMLNRR